MKSWGTEKYMRFFGKWYYSLGALSNSRERKIKYTYPKAHVRPKGQNQKTVTSQNSFNQPACWHLRLQ